MPGRNPTLLQLAEIGVRISRIGKGGLGGRFIGKAEENFKLAKNIKGETRFQFISRQIDFLLARCSF
jgi:hypothetical protein